MSQRTSLGAVPVHTVRVEGFRMVLKILCAGCSKDERERAETVIREELSQAGLTNAGTVSLVKIAGQWSVNMDGPLGRAITLNVPDHRLAESLRAALRPAEEAPTAGLPAPDVRPAPAVRPAPVHTDGRTPARCQNCSQGFVVVYDAVSDPETADAPAACPHCWTVNQVRIPAEAAFTRDYRTDKA